MHSTTLSQSRGFGDCVNPSGEGSSPSFCLVLILNSLLEPYVNLVAQGVLVPREHLLTLGALFIVTLSVDSKNGWPSGTLGKLLNFVVVVRS